MCDFCRDADIGWDEPSPGIEIGRHRIPKTFKVSKELLKEKGFEKASGSIDFGETMDAKDLFNKIHQSRDKKEIETLIQYCIENVPSNEMIDAGLAAYREGGNTDRLFLIERLRFEYKKGPAVKTPNAVTGLRG